MKQCLGAAAALYLSLAWWTSATEVADAPCRWTADPRTGFLTSLRQAGDPTGPEFIRPGQALGAVILRVRSPGGPWRAAATDAAFPRDTVIEPLGRHRADTRLYHVKFSRLGENLLTVRYGGGRTTQTCTARATAQPVRAAEGHAGAHSRAPPAAVNCTPQSQRPNACNPEAGHRSGMCKHSGDFSSAAMLHG